MSGTDPGNLEAEFALRHYLAVLWRRKLLIIAVALLGALVGVALGRESGPRTYTSTVQILFQPSAAEELFAPGAEASTAGRADPLSTEIAVMKSRSVRDPVVEAIGEPLRIEVAPLSGTQVVVLTASAGRRERAELVAQTYAETFISIRLDQLVSDLLRAIETVEAEVAAINAQLAEFDGPLRSVDERLVSAVDENARRILENERAEILAQRQPLLTRRGAFDEELDSLRLSRNLTATGGAQIISDATPARAAAGNQTRRSGAAGLALGLLVGVILAFGREHYDEAVKNLEGLDASMTPTPVLALIPRARRRWWRRGSATDLVVRSAPRSVGADAYRALWTAVELVTDVDSTFEAGRTVQVVSPRPRDGRTITAANLALLLARSGRRVTVVDANLRNPALHRCFGLANTAGLSSVLHDGAEVSSVLQAVAGEPGLRALTTGPARADGSTMLSSPQVHAILATLAADADVVLIDGPPLLSVADAVMWANAVDANVLLARVRHTRVPEIERAVDVLGQVHAPLVGAVLNGAGRRDASARVYGARRLDLGRLLGRRDRANHSPLPPGPTTVEVAPGAATPLTGGATAGSGRTASPRPDDR